MSVPSRVVIYINLKFHLCSSHKQRHFLVFITSKNDRLTKSQKPEPTDVEIKNRAPGKKTQI